MGVVRLAVGVDRWVLGIEWWAVGGVRVRFCGGSHFEGGSEKKNS